MKWLLKILPVIIIFGFTQTANMPTGNWYQQFLPSPSGGTLKDIYFIDSLLGFAVTDSCILKTTNRGDNWSINLQGFYIFQRIKFLNSQTGFACAGNNRLLKTTNSGGNWTETTPGGIFPSDMSVLNQDTIWLVDPEGFSGGVFRTTNGGTNWTLQFSMFNNNPDKIYMFNRNLGFISHLDASLYRTMNSGVNWMPISGTDGFRDMKFVDTLT